MADPNKTFRAVHRWARIAPRKARLLTDMVRGLPVDDALAVLDHHPRRAAALLRKVVRSAMANASQDLDVDLKALVVSEARVDMGPLLGGRPRWRPRAMGRALPIHKRTSHLIIGLQEEAARRSRRGRKVKARPAPAAKAEDTGEGEEAAAKAGE